MSRYKELTQAQRCRRITTIVVMLIYSAITLALAINSFTSLSSNLTVVLDTIDNWKTGTIIDVVAGPNGNCPAGYETATNLYWPGVYSGCDCYGASDPDFEALGLSSGSCNSTELSYGCVDVPGYDSVKYASWGSISGTPQAICLQRNGETFADIGPDQGFDCPSGETLCGDTPDNYFCTAEAQCPITSLVVVSADCGANCVQFDDSKWVEIYRGEDRLPLAEMRLNEYGMCLDANERCENPDREYYSLIKTTGTDCAGVGTPLWEIFDTIDETTLFSYNGLTADIANLDYYYPDQPGTYWDYNTYSRTYVPFKYKCRSNMGDIIDNAGNFQGIKSSHLALMIVSIISFVVIGVTLPILEILNLGGTDLPCFSGKGEEERKKVLSCKRIFYFTFKFLMLPFQIWAIVSLSKTKDLMKFVADDDCSSTYMNKLIDETAVSLNSSFTSDVVAIIMLILFTLLAIVGIIRGDKKEKEERGAAKPNQVVNEPAKTEAFNQDPIQMQTQYQPIQQEQSYQQQPVYQQQPGFQQPMYQQPGFQQPGFQQPGFQQPGFQQQPMYQQPGFQQQQPMYQQPGFQQPMYQQQPQPQQITIQIDPAMMQQLQQQQQMQQQQPGLYQ